MGYYTHKKAPLIRTEEVNIPFHTGWHDYPGQELPAYLSVFDVAPDINVEVYVVKGQTKVFYFRELLVNPETKEILVYGKHATPLGRRETIHSWINTYYKKTSNARLWVEDRRRELTNQTTTAGVTI
jgi:hypothetical protein